MIIAMIKFLDDMHWNKLDFALNFSHFSGFSGWFQVIRATSFVVMQICDLKAKYSKQFLSTCL